MSRFKFVASALEEVGALLQPPRRADVQCRAKMVRSRDDHGASPVRSV
jgi:hypothetical protein